MASIFFHNENTSYRLNAKRKLKAWIAYTVEAHQKTPGDINIILCSDTYLYKMNMEYLNHDTYTDVITFDYCDDNIVTGDIFISIDRVRENAKKYAVTMEKEVRRVIIHGVLHLCGQEDKQPSERAVMTQKENRFLTDLNSLF